jgi:hypothetical protein
MPKCDGCGKEIAGRLFYERKLKNKSFFSCSVPCRQAVELKVRKLRGGEKEPNPIPDLINHIIKPKKKPYQKIKITITQLENIPTWPGIGENK